jgi:hypothetical protein
MPLRLALAGLQPLDVVGQVTVEMAGGPVFRQAGILHEIGVAPGVDYAVDQPDIVEKLAHSAAQN